MSKSKKDERIGVEFTTNEGYQVIIIEYVDNKEVQVMFLDEHKWTTWTRWRVLQSGKIKNPFHKSVFGVGFLGTDENGNRPITIIDGVRTREYDLWKRMLQRCYDKKFLEKYPTYKNVTVCDRWHSFSKFLEDLPKIKDYELWKKHPNERITLNKDIYYTELGIQTDCKEYSLLTTRFITDSESSREMAERTGFSQVRKKLN